MKPCKHGHVDGVMHIPCPKCKIERLEHDLAAANKRADKLRQERDSARQAEEKESERWAKRLEWIHREYDADASGCDSGDALDCVEIEIRQALCKATERAQQAAYSECALICRSLVPECCGKYHQSSFDLPPECCGDFQPREQTGTECADAIERAASLPPTHVCVPRNPVMWAVETDGKFHSGNVYHTALLAEQHLVRAARKEPLSKCRIVPLLAAHEGGGE